MTLPGNDLDALLATSKPDPYEYDPSLRTRVREVSIAAEAEVVRESSRRRAWWRKPQVVIGAFGVLLLGTTGGAMATQVSSTSFWIDGKLNPLDATVPIYYEMASHETVHCSVGLYYGHVDPNADVTGLKSFVANHDWSGIGQRMYDRAIQNPFTPGPNDDMPPDVAQWILDDFSFTTAMGDVINEEIPPELLPDGTTGSISTNCDRKLR